MSSQEANRGDSKLDDVAQSGEGDDVRTLAEWVTLIGSLTILLAAFIAVGYLYLNDDHSPISLRAEANLDDIRESNDAFFVPVTVFNEGDSTASNVQIQADLMMGDQVESSGFSILVLSGNDNATGIIAFTQDPRDGEFVVRVASYIE